MKSETFQVDRRTTIKWVLGASAALPLMRQHAFGTVPTPGKGYGTDPKLTPIYTPGELWPLTLTRALKRTAAALCDVIIPADAGSPGAAAVGVVDFIDEWISAPYPIQQADRKTILWGLDWLDATAKRRFGGGFAALEAAQQTAICDEICYLPRATPQLAAAATFFTRYRDLTAGGFYTTPAGAQDLKYVGNQPMTHFNGPPQEVLRKVGLSEAIV